MLDLDQTEVPADGAATEVTHGNDAHTKEGRRKGHDQVYLPPLGHFLPLCIDRDGEERNKEAYHIIKFSMSGVSETSESTYQPRESARISPEKTPASN